MKRILMLSVISLLINTLSFESFAQRTNSNNYVTVQIVSNSAERVYKVGEDVKITIAVMKDTYPQPNTQVRYEWGPDMLTATSKGDLNTDKGYKTITLKGMNRPGFMTCIAKTTIDGIEYSNYTTVGFEPQNIKPTTEMPSDFKEFWNEVLKRSSKIALEPLMTLMPEYCTHFADVYHIRFQNSAPGKYIYGVLSIPKVDGVCPAVLKVPGAGVRAYTGDTSFAQDGIICLEIGIHGIPVNLPAQIYADLRANSLSAYNTYNNDNRDKYYYKNVYSGCVKAIDFLCSLPKVDTSRLGVCGGSQGGALSIITASLDNRIKYLYSNYPALGEIGGYYHGSTGGWPRVFRDSNETNIETKVKVSEYYDVVNFARLLKVPGLYTFGFNDMVCPPTSTYAVYNAIKAPKEIFIPKDCGHWLFPEHYKSRQDWLINKLKN